MYMLKYKLHPITDGIDSFCRKRKKETGEWKQLSINVPALNNKYPYANGKKKSDKGSYFYFFPKYQFIPYFTSHSNE